MKINIREEQQNEYSIVHNLIECAFRNEAFSDHKEHFLVDRLRRSDAYIPQLSLVAESAGEVVGYILMTKAQIVSEAGTVATLCLAPVSVLPHYQGMGIGSALIREVHRRAAEAGWCSAVLLGHKDYYPRFGYRQAADFGIVFPFDVPQEYCMVVELLPDGLKNVHGAVRFAPPFMA